MQIASKWLKAISATACLMAVTACGTSTTYNDQSAGLSARSSAPARRVPAMSIDVHRMVQRVQEAMDRNDFAQAKLILATILEHQKINDYERAVAWQLKAMIAYEEDNLLDTIKSYEQILTYANSIPEALELNIIYGLSQLYYSQEDWSKSFQYAQTWETRIDPILIGVSQLQYFAHLHYVREEYADTLSYINQAIGMSQSSASFNSQEAWYQLALSSYWEMKQYDKVAATLETMLAHWPKPVYCTQFAGIRLELGETLEVALAKTRASSPVCVGTKTTGFPTKVTSSPFTKLAQATTNQASPLPIVRSQPQYPRKAIEDRVEGYAVVELTIETDGSVDPDSIIILEAEPKGYFEEVATRTVSKFKYKPKIVDGQPQRITGVKYRFSWELGG